LSLDQIYLGIMLFFSVVFGIVALVKAPNDAQSIASHLATAALPRSQRRSSPSRFGSYWRWRGSMAWMREALRNLLGGIHWRALAAASALSLLAIGVLAATDAPAATTSIVLGGAGALIALSIAGEALTSARSTTRSYEPDAAPSRDAHLTDTPTAPPAETP
jgi:hypothetical protein